MNKEQAQKAIDYLNELLEADEDAISQVLDYGILCNNTLADHPTCQVRHPVLGDNDQCRVSALGVINGIFGTNENGRGWISVSYEQDEEGFKILCFNLNED